MQPSPSWNRRISRIPTTTTGIALAYQAKGDKEKAKQYLTRAAKFNGLPLLNYAYHQDQGRENAGQDLSFLLPSGNGYPFPFRT